MKKILLIAFIVVLAFSVLACSNTNQSGQQGGVAGTAVIGGSNSSNTSGTVSPLTGMPGITEYRPVQVQIDNESTGRPQYGIQDADVVYEGMIEGADTRLSAIFNDTLPAKVGPVRSSRVYFQYIQNEWDSIYIHDGGPYAPGFPKSYIYSPENGGDMKVRIDNTKKGDDKITWGRDMLPCYTNVQAAETKYNYQRTQRSLLFKFNSKVDYSKYQSFSTIGIPFLGGNGDRQVEYRYDASKDLLTRYNYGQPFRDADTNKAVTVQNIIVQYVTRAELPGEGTATTDTRILLGMIGNGKADFFIGGKHMTGTWTKADRHAGTVYKLDDGSDLVLKPGNTWIELQPDSKTITVS
jgi:hypothetical protein